MDALTIIATIAGAMLTSGGVTALVTHLLNSSGKNDPVRIGIRLMLQDRIEYFGMKAIDDGRITYAQRRTLNAMHDCYHNGLHGNGDLDAIMEDVNDLEVIYPTRKSKSNTKGGST